MNNNITELPVVSGFLENLQRSCSLHESAGAIVADSKVIVCNERALNSLIVESLQRAYKEGYEDCKRENFIATSPG